MYFLSSNETMSNGVRSDGCDKHIVHRQCRIGVHSETENKVKSRTLKPSDDHRLRLATLSRTLHIKPWRSFGSPFCICLLQDDGIPTWWWVLECFRSRGLVVFWEATASCEIWWLWTCRRGRSYETSRTGTDETPRIAVGTGETPRITVGTGETSRIAVGTGHGTNKILTRRIGIIVRWWHDIPWITCVWRVAKVEGGWEKSCPNTWRCVTESLQIHRANLVRIKSIINRLPSEWRWHQLLRYSFIFWAGFFWVLLWEFAIYWSGHLWALLIHRTCAVRFGVWTRIWRWRIIFLRWWIRIHFIG